MRSRTRPHLIVAITLMLALALAVPAGASHGGSSSDELEVVGRLDVPFEGLTTDIWAYGNYAYIGSFNQPECSLDLTGVRIIDIGDPTNPAQVAFIPAHPDARNNDVKVAHIETPSFSGEILVATNEPCGAGGFHPKLVSQGEAVIGGDSTGQSGVDIWDVTDPTDPKALKLNFLDFPVHNTYIWQQGERAYMLVVDDINARDVHIVDITNPSAPREVAVTGAPDWPDDIAAEIEGAFAGLHDVWAQENDGRVIAYLSYWDAGLVLLDVTDPANPVFLGDSTYPELDPFTGLPTEGNSHVAVPTADGSLVVMGDEDFSPYRTVFTVDTGDFAGEYPAVEGFFTKKIVTLDDKEMDGPSTFVGLACDGSPIPEPTGELAEGEDDEFIAVIERGDCRFDEKISNVAEAGYGGAVVFNRVDVPDELVLMGGDPALGTIPAVFTTRFGGFAILGIDPSSDPETELPPVGTSGEHVTAKAVFDGWGYMRILDVTDPENIVELGQFATEGVFDEDVALIGDRTAHNVIVAGSLAYWSWYDEGIRVVDFTNPKNPREIAHYVDPGGSNFWGVYLHEIDGVRYILGSDRDSGLWIFADPADSGGKRRR